jgi:hypothetical protein
MTMTPHLCKFALTAHVTSSVGLLGAIAGFLALAVAGLTSQYAQMARAAYLAMLVPVALSLYKPRGVTRYGWRKQHTQRALSQP